MLGNARVSAVLPVRDLAKARRFYEETLGLKVWFEMPQGLSFECGGGTLLTVYERPPVQAEHTQASFEVDDIESTMRDLKAKGVQFEDYDLPNLKTENGVATYEGMKSAWFRDPDGNILGLASMGPRRGGLSVNR